MLCRLLTMPYSEAFMSSSSRPVHLTLTGCIRISWTSQYETRVPFGRIIRSAARLCELYGFKMSQSIDHVRGAVRSVCQHRLVASTVHIAQEMPVSRSRKWDADNTWIIVLLTELVARFCQVP